MTGIFITAMTESKAKDRTVTVLDSNDAIGRAAAEIIGKASSKAIKARDRFVVAFSGGSLPEIVGKGLLASNRIIDYSKWIVFYADERCVALDHADSNYKLTVQHLFGKVKIDSKNIHPIDASLASDPAKCAAAYESALLKALAPASDASASGDSKTAESKEAGEQKQAAIPEFDMLLLGMGPDGHCCSLFPGHKLLSESKLLIAPITDSPKPPPNRVTMTLPLLNRARDAVWVVTGDAKKDAIAQIMKGGSELPSALVHARESNVWLLDKGAASGLDAKL